MTQEECHVFHSEQDLEDLLSLPSEEDKSALRKMEGDLLILGAGGKMGPTLARRARRAADQAGVAKRIIGVDRFPDPGLNKSLRDNQIETVEADLLDFAQINSLPDAENVVFMVGRKFGSAGAEPVLWATNVYLAARIAERYHNSKIVAYSSGNVYPFVAPGSRGATEETPPRPVGEYAQSVLARERIFEFFSERYGTGVCLLRLNYAVDLRYGVLLDIGTKVFRGCPVDLSMGYLNAIWQGDANSVCLRSFALCQSPARVLNMTGPEVLSVREVALKFGALLGREPVFQGHEAETALLNNAGRCHQLFGPPSVSVDKVIEWTAGWIRAEKPTWDKPTHFETRDGKF
jgi:nucleoside-diphosphate-sugar epimerase